jgi:hypothetical protein
MYSTIPIYWNISNLLQPAQAEVMLGQLSTYLASWTQTQHWICTLCISGQNRFHYHSKTEAWHLLGEDERKIRVADFLKYSKGTISGAVAHK